MVSPIPQDAPSPEGDTQHKLLAVAVGNTRTQWAVFTGRKMTSGGAPPHAPPHAAPHAEAIESLRTTIEQAEPDILALASVDDEAAARIEKAIVGFGLPLLRVGRDLLPPLTHTLKDASTLGIDRALNALAAYSIVESAVAIVDAGSAITVDFVDGEGTFHGGAIAPGCAMMLRAMHAQTAALPSLDFDPDAVGPFGNNTPHAMQLGVAAAARGLVREMVEQFAVYYEAYPLVLGTGGDAADLFEADEFVERIIPDLQLIGIQRTIEAAMQEEEE